MSLFRQTGLVYPELVIDSGRQDGAPLISKKFAGGKIVVNTKQGRKGDKDRLITMINRGAVVPFECLQILLVLFYQN